MGSPAMLIAGAHYERVARYVGHQIGAHDGCCGKGSAAFGP
jgi:hypothetical protein